MGWSNFFPFTEASIKKEAPDNKHGIYRICLQANRGFRVENDTKQNYWIGLRNLTTYLRIRIQASEPFRVAKGYKTVYSNLVYVGKAEDQSLQDRLLDQVRSQGNKGLATLLKHKVTLYFSYRIVEKKKVTAAEQNFYQKYLNLSNKFCPPSDCCSNECQKFNGSCTDSYLLANNKNYRLCPKQTK